MTIRSFLRAAIVTTGLAANGALAIAAPGSEPRAITNGTVAPVLWLEATTVPNHLELETLRIAIENELRVPVSLVRPASFWGHVQIEGAARSDIIVHYESTDGTTKLERRVALPVDASRQAQVIAWVTGNLVRNEAAELLAQASQSQPIADALGATREAEPQPPVPAIEPVVQPSAPVAQPPKQPPPQVPVANATPAEPDLGPSRAVHAAFISPWVAVHSDAAIHRYHLSFGGIYSHVGALNGFGLGLAVDRIEYASRGVQLSGLWLDGAAHHGLLLAGVGTHAHGALTGVELAGALALRSGNVTGAQVTGALNVAQNVQGLQLSLVNVAHDVRGLQLSLVNVAEDVDGVQFGFVNVARKNRGIALGLFNWSEGARLQPIYFFQNPGYHNVGYRNLSGHATSTMSFGYDEARKRARTHFALGARTTFGRVSLGAETGYGWVLENMTNGPTDRAHELDLIGTVTVELFRNRLSVFGGGGASLPVAGVVPAEPHGLAQVGISLF